MSPGARRRRRLAWQAVFLAVAGVSIYLLLPSILEVFTSWHRLDRLRPEWVAVAVAAEAASFAAYWELERLALQTRAWFPVATAQLAGNALGRIVPGGAATAGALQYRLLVRAGLPGGRVASSLTAVTVLLFGTVLALPLLSLPALLGGTSAPAGLAQAAYLGAAAFAVMLAGGVTAFAFDRPLALVGEAVEWVLGRTVRRGDPPAGLAERLLHERDSLRTAFGRRWRTALAAAAGNWLFDYLALVAILRAVGTQPSPSLVLLAYVAAALLTIIPFTPGGLGFVEAGLAALLVLAGVGAGSAVLATLAYRLVSFWLPIPVGGAAYLLFRRRYP